MSINQISNINSFIEHIKPVVATKNDSDASFTKVFESAVDNVNKAESTLKQDEIMVATGQADDLHTVMIDAAKAELALSMLVQVRNKALDAYNEIMRMTL